MIRTPRRPATTLLEVLIATGILAIGLLAILSLFPIGAVNMARAINQNRAADHASNSDTVFRLYWKRAWLSPNDGGLRPLDGFVVPGPPPSFVPGAKDIEPMMVWLDSIPDPNTGLPVRVIVPTSTQPSFPVLVDPVGVRTQAQFGPNYQNYISGMTNLPRRANLSATPTATPDNYPLRATVRNTTMLDEYSYDGNGEPSALSGQIDRGGRYNVAWWIQRPKNNVPHQVHLQVLVFAGRSPTDTAVTEQVFPAFATDYAPDVEPKPKSLTIQVGGQRPALLKGKWIAFTTPIQPQPYPPPPNSPPGTYGVPYPAFDFYRIAAVDEVDPNTVIVELELPLRSYGGTISDAATMQAVLPGWVQTSATPVSGTLNGNVVVFDTLFEVFDRGVVSAGAQAGR